MGAGVVSTERDVEQCVCAIRPAAVAQSAKRRRDYLGTAGLAASPSAAATAGTLLGMGLQTSLASGIYTGLRQNVISLGARCGFVF